MNFKVIGRLIFWWPILFFILFISFWPVGVFNDPYTSVIEDSSGKLLSARIANDGQWRFPVLDTVPESFQDALKTFEDKRFESHTGFDPLAFSRAIVSNIESRSIVSGGSTLSMQVIRLSRKGQSRSISEKIVELLYSIALEWQHPKREIMSLYASHAPFGGNIVGLEAACWRYYSLNVDQLSVGEYAALSVLPNAPSLVFPGKNELTLKKKRDTLISRLSMDSESKELGKAEPLPGKVKPLPRLAPHLLNRCIKEHPGLRIKTTIDGGIQAQAVEIVNRHSYQLQKSNHIYNAAAIIIEVETGAVLAYVGNTMKQNEDHGNAVDVIGARRSTGSILKPILYASMQESGELLPKTLVYDIPTFISGYSPKNFNPGYDGAVTAKNALYRSLNIPAVRMLQSYGIERFRSKLVDIGLSTIDQSSSHYGLSLILGGAETTLWDLSGAYSSMARSLKKFDGTYDEENYHSVYYEYQPELRDVNILKNDVLKASACYLTFKALEEVNRPIQEMGWEYYGSSQKIAWKTGTSFGFRDAWAVGTTPEYVVAVWVGNADGEGRPGLTGVSAAAPIMFDLFRTLGSTSQFEAPYDEMKKLETCSSSGMLATINCPTVDTVLSCSNGSRSGPCQYHELLNLSLDGKYQVNASCVALDEMVQQPWFVLPPAVAYYYQSKHPEYRQKPPMKEGCADDNGRSMQLIYPRNASQIFIPKEMSGHRGEVVFEIAHQRNNSVLFWHLDGEFLGQTSKTHQRGLAPSKGIHSLVVVDDDGNILEKEFEIVN